MPLIELKDFNFSYASTDGSEKTFECLHDINLEINYGDFVLLCGPSGCGKTTLLSNLKKELIPNGLRSGIARYNGIGISQLDDETSACDIGYLFQNPDSQIVTDTVIQEIAFPLENIGVSSEEIRNRISELAAFFGLNDILHKNVNELSGGQKQLVNLCSLLVLRPKVLLLDEPMSQLDPIASYDFLSILRRLNEEFSITILISEHKSDNIFSSWELPSSVTTFPVILPAASLTTSTWAISTSLTSIFPTLTSPQVSPRQPRLFLENFLNRCLTGSPVVS